MTEPAQTASRSFLPRLTLHRRIVGTVALLSAVALLAAGLVALVVERARIVEDVQRTLGQEIGEFRELAVQGLDPETGESFASAERLITVSMERNIPDANEVHIGFVENATIVSIDGEGSLHREEEFRTEISALTESQYGRYASPEHGEVLYAALPIETGGTPSHYVVVHFLDAEFQELHNTIQLYGIAALLSWLGLTLAAWLLARHIVRPINELSTTADLIGETDLSRRIHISGGDEVAALGTTFNRMLDRLQAALGAQRRMLDDAGHELRTPITVVRGHLELMDPADPADVESTRDLAIDELDRMNLLVQDLILLAKSQRPDFLVREVVELDLLVSDVRDKALALGERDWLLDASEPLTIEADPRRLTQALLQLASNAYKVTDEGDTIAFGCASSSSGIQLWVRDTGPGVPPSDRRRIFNRFQSGTGVSPGGSGLGLAIVRAIAEAHEGTAYVTAATSAGGAKFIIELPPQPTSEASTEPHPALERTSPSEELPELDPANDTQPRGRPSSESSGEHLLDRIMDTGRSSS